ncbi:MAG: hypothetical protein J07HQX50_02484 [Haloquadratum sp. J07HQX50]|jgi:hypothetical protein|nr:MAG: hypothetical protein J07HQX50_02484 [Haloquadratum sp. J07HQX50]
MSYSVRYYCPHCGQVFEIERAGYLADKSVTPYPLIGWEYVSPTDSFESADGIQLVCGNSSTDKLSWTEMVMTADDIESPEIDSPCGKKFYLSFVRFEDGVEVEPRPDPETVELSDSQPSPDRPQNPGPGGPFGF